MVFVGGRAVAARRLVRPRLVAAARPAALALVSPRRGLAGGLSMIAMEAGWITTEVGRQPWVVYGIMRTSEAVTHAPGIWGSFAIVVGALHRRRRRASSCAAPDGAALARRRGPSRCPGRTRRAAPLVLPGPAVPGLRRRRPTRGRRMSTIAALILWFGVTSYAVFGGADYGAGFWDLTAGGAKRGARPRALIDQAMAPVWEANNVWLIFALVVLWTAFPRAFASIMSALFVPMSLAAAGIVLRGSAFVFRKPIQALTGRRLLGAAFARVVGVDAVLPGHRVRRDRVGSGAGRRSGRRSALGLDRSDADADRRARGSVRGVSGGGVPGVRRAPGARRRRSSATSGGARSAAPPRPACSPWPACSC